MINSAEIIKKSEKHYSSFLTSIITGTAFFPLQFNAGAPPKDYMTLLKAVTELNQNSKVNLGYGYLLESKTINTQKYGPQTIPERIIINTEEDYLKLLKKQKEVAEFKPNIDLILSNIPELKPWLIQNPLKVIQNTDKWHNLLEVCRYFQNNPQPNLYIRELPISVHTKFIEQNQSILGNLLEAILPPETLQPVEGEKYRFEKRFSLKYEQPLIRLRILDKTLQTTYNFPISDLMTPISEFQQLTFQQQCCFITENMMNFLTLPPLQNSIAVFGKGYAVQLLKSVKWLQNCSIFYWGDLDAHGFTILSQCRGYFPQTVSIMMDEETFSKFAEFTVHDTSNSTYQTLPNLTPPEQTLYSYLCHHKKRLEQERIHQTYVKQYLKNILTHPTD